MKIFEIGTIVQHPAVQAEAEFVELLQSDDIDAVTEFIMDDRIAVSRRLQMLRHLDELLGDPQESYTEDDLAEFMWDTGEISPEEADEIARDLGFPPYHLKPVKEEESGEYELCIRCGGEGCHYCNDEGLIDITGEFEIPSFDITEGGWESVKTQDTKITPSIVKAALAQVKKFTADFNAYLQKQNVPQVKMGHPTGSSAYYGVDDESSVYGDIDLQMIVPAIDDMTTSQLTSMYNSHMNDFIKSTKPSYVYDEGKEIRGHVIFIIGEDAYVQVDMIWARDDEADWARYRTTPERGVKGLVYGSLFSSFGEVINMSMQNSGAQMKIKDGKPVNFQRSRKVDSVETLSLDIENVGLDILKGLFTRIYPNVDVSKMRIDSELKQNPGLKRDDIRMSSIIGMIRGLGKSFEANKMYGKYNLADVSSYDDLIEQFLAHFGNKMEASKTAKKFDKAATPEAKAKVEKIRKQIDDGYETVRKLIYA